MPKTLFLFILPLLGLTMPADSMHRVRGSAATCATVFVEPGYLSVGGCYTIPIKISSDCAVPLIAKADIEYTGTDVDEGYCSGKQQKRYISWVSAGETVKEEIPVCLCWKTHYAQVNTMYLDGRRR